MEGRTPSRMKPSAKSRSCAMEIVKSLSDRSGFAPLPRRRVTSRRHCCLDPAGLGGREASGHSRLQCAAGSAADDVAMLPLLQLVIVLARWVDRRDDLAVIQRRLH